MRFKCPPILLFLFFFGNITVVAKIPGKVDKAFESLQDFNYFEAKKLFEKSQSNYPCLSSYGLSLIYFRTDNPFHNVDSAYFRIKQSIVAYMSPSKNEIDKLLEHNVDGNVLQGVKTGVEKLAYQNAIGSLDIEKLNHFLGVYIGAAGYADAARKSRAGEGGDSAHPMVSCDPARRCGTGARARDDATSSAKGSECR